MLKSIPTLVSFLLFRFSQWWEIHLMLNFRQIDAYMEWNLQNCITFDCCSKQKCDEVPFCSGSYQWRESWILDIRGNITPIAFSEFFLIRDLVREVHLLPDSPYHHFWTPPSCSYSSKSAYDHFMVGTISFEPIGHCQHANPLVCCWDRCWAVDCLAKSGMDHLVPCPLLWLRWGNCAATLSYFCLH